MNEKQKKYVETGGTRCFNCNSSALDGGSVEVEAGWAVQSVDCQGCGATWRDVYKLVDVSAVQLPDLTTFEKAHALHKFGYYLGPRDPKRNQAHQGAWMICEDVDEEPSLDARNGEYCIVGDNFDELIDIAYDSVFPLGEGAQVL